MSKSLTYILIILGIILPFLLVKIIPSYFVDDVGAFHVWADCLRQNPQDIYSLCKPDYPATGLLFSGGAIYLIKILIKATDRSIIDAVFRYYLACFDALNFLLLIWLASLLKFRFPVRVGLAILAVPSTWVGGAIWGQIDGISLFFCLLTTLGFFQFWVSLTKTEAPRFKFQKRNYLWLLLATTSLAIYWLSKQLTLFSLPFFCAIFLISTGKLWQYFRFKGIVIACFFIFLFTAFFSFLDSFFTIPESFHHSSYWFGWQQGFQPSISGNGFNIWMFLGWPMSASPYFPFVRLNLGLWQTEISPYAAGIVLYAMFMVFLILTGFKAACRLLKSDLHNREKSDTYLMSLLCLFLGLSYLGFNVLLTGTHERYLHLGYPFLLLAVTWFYSQNILFSWRLLIFCFAAAAAYGFFVLSVIYNYKLVVILFPLKRHEFLASIHLFLLLLLWDGWCQACRQARQSLTCQDNFSCFTNLSRLK
jgi:hypothetical protein